MGNLLKYLVISLFGILLTGTDGKADSTVAENLFKELCDECVQYQHTVFEPVTTVFVNVNESNFSSTNTIRVQKKNKRSSGGHRYYSVFAKHGKHYCSDIYTTLFQKTAIHTPYLAHNSHKLVSLGKLII